MLLAPPPDDPEPKTERLPLASSDAPAMTFPYRSMVATPNVPSGAPLRKAPDSFESMSTSFSAAPAAGAVAWSLARPSGAPPAPVVETRMSEKLEPLLAACAGLFVVAEALGRPLRVSAKIEDSMERLRGRWEMRT